MRECKNCGALLFGQMSINGLCVDCSKDEAELADREERRRRTPVPTVDAAIKGAYLALLADVARRQRAS